MLNPKESGACRQCKMWNSPTLTGYGICDRLSARWGQSIKVYGGNGGVERLEMDVEGRTVYKYVSIPNACFIPRGKLE